MNRIERIVCWLAAAAAVLPCPLACRDAKAADPAVVKDSENPCNEPVIEGYQPNTFGYTKQSDDVAFVDFTVSIKAQLLQSLLCEPFGGKSRLYFTFTGRFGFYVRTRYSSPVIAKNYNPKLVWRLIPDPSATTPTTTYRIKPASEYARYVDFAYAHDSNGQSIDTVEEYVTQLSQVHHPEFALDYVSRGWDYIQVAGKETLSDHVFGRGVLALYPDIKIFLRHGLFQGVPEEIHSWERDTTLRPRHAFDGLTVAFEYQPFAQLAAQTSSGERPARKSGLRLQLKYTTGYDPVARYNTVRGELGFHLYDLPLTVWVQDGYMNSLARYYRKAHSAGVEIRFAEF